MNEPVRDRDAAIRELFPLVRRLARRVKRVVPGSELDDLVGDGAVGLIRAVDSYDCSRGPSLRRYAARIAVGAMLNGLRRLDPVSERVRRELREAERERYAIANQTGTLPTKIEMEQRRPALRRATLHAHRYVPLSLDASLPFDEGLSADWTSDPARIAVAGEQRRSLAAALERLPQRQRRVLAMHYFDFESLHVIGRQLCVSAQRASQLHKAALRNMRKVIGDARTD